MAEVCTLLRGPARRLAALILVLAALTPTALAQGKAPGPPAAGPADDYYFMSDDLIRKKDGNLVWYYVTNHVSAQALRDSLTKLKLPGLTLDTRKKDEFKIRFDKKEKRIDLSATAQRTQVDDPNVLILTFQPAYRDLIEEFVARFDQPEPQVYIKAKVVEVTLDSNFEWGVSMFFDRGGEDGANNPNAFFRSFRTSFRPGSFQNPFGSSSNTGVAMLFDDLEADEIFTMQIEALQERGSANLLSEPSIVATQGQLASIITGQRTPVSEITIVGASERISTRFEDTGIRFDFEPLHIGREYVKMRVRVETSSVTGIVEIQGQDINVPQPIISERTAETVVTIRDGMTFVIGGLYAISEIEDSAGVPILGDIPVLKWLFSKQKKEKVKSELDFFISPRILHTHVDKGVFVPPGESKRLERVKRGGRSGENLSTGSD
jgi:type II secretory pathway component GspD/PulD (secretin)